MDVYNIPKLVYLFNNEKFDLPIRYNDCYERHLKNLLDNYLEQYKKTFPTEKETYKIINKVCKYINNIIQKYLDGFPSQAYKLFVTLMRIYEKGFELKMYEKSMYGFYYDDPLKLYRVTTVNDDMEYPRSRLFHVPYNKRERIDACRYSIAGYPSLYLATNLRLCCEEIHFDPLKINLAARFELNRNIQDNHINIKVLEMAVKPMDFINILDISELKDITHGDDDLYNNILKRKGKEQSKRVFDNFILEKSETIKNYLIWYPLIAACSYIRCYKNASFKVEYVIPQMLMQYVRKSYSCKKNTNYYENVELVGIRYFSCSSKKASEMGFNYVFPASGEEFNSNVPYCKYLARSIKLTEPKIIHEYENIDKLEEILKKDNDLDYII